MRLTSSVGAAPHLDESELRICELFLPALKDIRRRLDPRLSWHFGRSCTSADSRLTSTSTSPRRSTASRSAGGALSRATAPSGNGHWKQDGQLSSTQACLCQFWALPRADASLLTRGRSPFRRAVLPQHAPGNLPYWMLFVSCARSPVTILKLARNLT